MTDRTIRTLQESYELVVPVLDSLVRGSLERFFARCPELRPMFPADPRSYVDRFAAELSAIVEGLTDWPHTLANIERLGRSHSRFGARPEHFDALNASVMEALEDTLSAQFTTEIELAWRQFLATLSRVMMDAQEFGIWSIPIDERGNPFAPIMGVSVERYALIVSELGSINDREISAAELAEFGLDRQTWEAVRSGWNSRLTDPTIGGVVAVAYVDAARSHSEGQRRTVDHCGDL